MKLPRYKVEWSEVASADLDGLLAFIALDSLRGAFKVLDRIESKAGALSTLPLRGRVVPELARFQIRIYRELIITPYRLLYRVEERRVWVVGVFDGRRNLEDVLLERVLSWGKPKD